MWRLRFLAYLLLTTFLLAVFCLKNALAQQRPPTQQKPPPSKPAEPPPKADPEAEKIMARAVEAQEPKLLGPIKMDIWQKMTLGGLAITAEGHYFAAPKQLVRHEMHLTLGDCKGEMLTVCNGTTAWNTLQIGNLPPVITKWDMKKIQDTLNAPGTQQQVGEGFFFAHGFAGVLPLLKSLQGQMTFTKQEAETWEDHAGKKHKVIKLTGVWMPEVTKFFPSAWPPLIPRLAKLYIDQDKPHWLYRLEFWGKNLGSVDETILLQMEFRNPEQTQLDAKLFTFDPGSANVEDKTQEKINQISEARRRQQTQKPQK